MPSGWLWLLLRLMIVEQVIDIEASSGPSGRGACATGKLLLLLLLILHIKTIVKRVTRSGQHLLSSLLFL